MKAYIIVHGIVQGVGYRAFVKGIADEYGVKGMVKNIDDGSVGIFADIETKKALEKFVEKINVKGRQMEVFHIEIYNEFEEGYKEMGSYTPFKIIL
jgi:acylphosphatase